MSKELYIWLFHDAFLGNLVITLHTEVIYGSVKAFGTSSTISIMIVAIVASFCAFSINYIIGMALSQIFKNKNNQPQKIANNFLINIFLLFSAIPFFGKFIPLFCGGLKISYSRTMCVCIIAKFCYYLIF